MLFIKNCYSIDTDKWRLTWTVDRTRCYCLLAVKTIVSVHTNLCWPTNRRWIMYKKKPTSIIYLWLVHNVIRGLLCLLHPSTSIIRMNQHIFVLYFSLTRMEIIAFLVVTLIGFAFDNHFQRPEKRRELRLKKFWRSPKTTSSEDSAGGDSPTHMKHSRINQLQLSPVCNRPTCSLPLLQVWPSQVTLRLCFDESTVLQYSVLLSLFLFLCVFVTFLRTGDWDWYRCCCYFRIRHAVKLTAKVLCSHPLSMITARMYKPPWCTVMTVAVVHYSLITYMQVIRVSIPFRRHPRPMPWAVCRA